MYWWPITLEEEIMVSWYIRMTLTTEFRYVELSEDFPPRKLFNIHIIMDNKQCYKFRSPIRHDEDFHFFLLHIENIKPLVSV